MIYMFLDSPFEARVLATRMIAHATEIHNKSNSANHKTKNSHKLHGDILVIF